MSDADIVICGGSLAGAATAIRLKQRGLSAVIVEKSRFPRRKLCGEFLHPDSFDMLQRLGLWESVKAHAYGPIEQALFYPMQGRPVMIDFGWFHSRERYGIAIPRDTLDTLLLTQAKALGVAVLEHCRVLPEIRHTASKGFELSLLHSDSPQGTLETLTTRILVDATGRHGGLHTPPEALTAHKSSYTNLIGIQAHIRLSSLGEDKRLRMFFFPGGYGGLQPLGMGVANLCFLAPSKAALLLKGPFSELLAGTIAQNPAAFELLEGAAPLETFQTTANLNLTPWAPYRSHLIRVGDAMVTVDPFTGTGMALALESGILAAECLADGVAERLSYEAIRRRYDQRYHRRFGMRLAGLRLFRPYLFFPVLQRLTVPLIQPCLPLLTRVLR